MKNDRFYRLCRAVAPWVIAAVSAGCVGDKTEDEYRQGKVTEELSKIQKIEGTYRGNLTAMIDQQPLGAVTLVLQPDSKVQTSSDNLRSEQQAIVRGSLHYTGITNADMAFAKGFYDDQSGVFNATFAIPDSSGQEISINLKGIITNGVFSGQLEADGYSTFGGNFSLTKNGPEPLAQNLRSGRLQQMSSEREAFTGFYTYNGNPEPAVLTLIYPETAPEQLFMNVLLPVRNLQANLDFGDFQILFDGVHVDDRTRTLRGQTAVTFGTKKSIASLDCVGTVSANIITSWTCDFLVDGKVVQHLILNPARAGQK